jgi:hypothetical protein
MGTTTNNGWTYPESTDLVKDGATAIETLATNIDTTLGVYAPSTSGLELINTTSFSAVTAFSVNNVFSATYDNYRIVLNFTPSTNANRAITFRFRVGGVSESAASYSNMSIGLTTGNAASNIANAGVTSITLLANAYYGVSYYGTFDIDNPFVTKLKGVTGQSRGETVSNGQSLNVVGFLGNTTSYDGFEILNGTANFTGSISTYGYNK